LEERESRSTNQRPSWNRSETRNDICGIEETTRPRQARFHADGRGWEERTGKGKDRKRKGQEKERTGKGKDRKREEQEKERTGGGKDRKREGKEKKRKGESTGKGHMRDRRDHEARPGTFPSGRARRERRKGKGEEKERTGKGKDRKREGKDKKRVGKENERGRYRADMRDGGQDHEARTVSMRTGKRKEGKEKGKVRKEGKVKEKERKMTCGIEETTRSS